MASLRNDNSAAESVGFGASEFIEREQRATIGFAIAQFAATFAAAVLPFVEISLILVTWPLLACFGFLVCGVTWQLRSWTALAFGLSAPVATAIASILIFGLETTNDLRRHSQSPR
jgi:hypothetical protein